MQIKVLGVCYPEGRFNYNVIHTRSPSTKGVCGLKEIWGNIIPEINKNNINSLYAGSLVLEYLIEKNDGSFHKALVEYKGAEKNMKTVKKVYDTLKIIRKVR